MGQPQSRPSRIVSLFDGLDGRDGAFRIVLAVHLVLAASTFLPMFHGGVLIGSTDNYYYILPNLIFNLRQFQAGNFAPWNEYLLTGVDFSSSNYSFLYSPIYWLIYIFPESVFFQVFTAFNFILSVVAALSIWRFLTEETGSAKWALLGSVVYQIGGHFFFAVNMYPYFVGYALTAVCAWLIWTMHRRPSLWTLLGLTFTVTSFLTSCHIIRALMMLVLVQILWMYRAWARLGGPFRPSRHTATYYGAMVAAALLSSVRLLPILMAAPDSDRLTPLPFVKFSAASLDPYYILNAVVPEIFGVRAPFPSPFDPGITTHYAWSASYLGIVAAFLILYSFFARQGRPTFWIWFLLGALCFQLFVKPFNDVAMLLFYPAFHHFLLKILVPIPAVVLVAQGGRLLEMELGLRRHAGWIGLCLSLILMLVVVVMYRHYGGHATIAKVVILFLIALALFLARGSDRRVDMALAAILVGVGGLVAIGVPTWLLFVSRGAVSLASARAAFLGTLPVAAVLCLWLLAMRWEALTEAMRRLSMAAGALAMTALLFVDFPGYTQDAPRPTDELVLAATSTGRLVVMATFLATIMAAVGRGRLHRSALLPALLLVTVIDLTTYNRWYQNLITPGFNSGDAVQYPRRLDSLIGGKISLPAHASDPSMASVPPPSPPQTLIAPHGDEPATGWVARSMRVVAEGGVCQGGHLELQTAPPITTMYQDYTRPGLKVGTVLTFGAWVRAKTPGAVRLYLTDRLQGAYSAFHSGSDQWEWLEISSPLVEMGGYRVRPHVFGEGGTSYAVQNPQLLAGGEIDPFLHCPPTPEGAKLRAAMAVAQKAGGGSGKSVTIDAKHYRVAEPSAIFGIGGRYHYTHIPYLYGVRSFGGVNGFRSRAFLELFNEFNGPEDIRAGGGAHFEYLTSPRFLDIIGARYAMEGTVLIERPSALSRMMLFTDFEIAEDSAGSLARLKSPEFEPRQTLLLNSRPGVAVPAPRPSPARDLDFDNTGKNTVAVDMDAGSGGVLLFHDSFDSGWSADVDGSETPILRADHNFMAIVVPAGRHRVIFRFSPRDWPVRMGLAATGALLIMLLGFWLRRLDRLESDRTTGESRNNGAAGPNPLSKDEATPPGA